MDPRAPRFPNKLAILGVSFILAGGVLLLWTAGHLERFVNLWPLVLIIAGLSLLYVRIFRSGPDYHVFLGTSLLLAGVLLLLANTALPLTLVQIWPLFMTIFGVALVLYGFRKQGASRVTFTVPGAAMVLLSGVFLPFSLDLVSARFADFVGIWWPVLFVVMGVALLIVHSGRRRR